MSQLDENKADIVQAIEALNRLSIETGKHLDTIDAALDELPSALDSLDKQRDDLVKMLKALDDLSGVGVRVIRASKAATIDSLQQLDPVLTQLAAAGDDFANAFHVFLTYPFVDEVVGRDPQVARNLHMGDYTNLSIQLEVDLSDVVPTVPLPSLPTALPTLPTILPSLPDADPAADRHRPDQDRQRRAGLHRQRRHQQPRVPQGALDRAGDPRAPGGVQEARERRHRGLQGRQRRTPAHGADA